VTSARPTDKIIQTAYRLSIDPGGPQDWCGAEGVKSRSVRCR